jgi:hypothetical protein
MCWLKELKIQTLNNCCVPITELIRLKSHLGRWTSYKEQLLYWPMYQRGCHQKQNLRNYGKSDKLMRCWSVEPRATKYTLLLLSMEVRFGFEMREYYSISKSVDLGCSFLQSPLSFMPSTNYQDPYLSSCFHQNVTWHNQIPLEFSIISRQKCMCS